LPSFNDDIQGTAAMVVGGLIAATRRIGGKLTEHRVVIAGSGSAGFGIREQIAHAMEADGLDLDEARNQILVLDSRGLVVDDRPYLTDVKRRLAVSRDAVGDWEDVDDPPSLLDVVGNFQPTVLIGVSGIAGLFTEAVVREVGSHTERPIVMPLSNPTSHAEATPANVLRWTEGRAIVATGSPFSPVEYDGVVHRIGQANNVFVFPGMGLGVITVRAREVTNRMFLAAAHALAAFTTPELLEAGQIFPDISDVRAVSRSVAIAVASEAIAEDLAEPVDDLEAAIDAEMWEPAYIPFKPAGD
jgi:malate dehydrogenase (oxaloacetate-decarboxylating)